jgi:hypothetical protein
LKKKHFFIGTFKGLENEITKPKKKPNNPQNLKKKKEIKTRKTKPKTKL